jgi:hypothetical protein
MLLRELLATPELRLRLLVGEDAALERRVRWVYTTDLLDPGRYLSGGDLVISGLVWRRFPSDSGRFVAAIASAGAVALAAGEALLHGIPDDLVEACRRHGLPLLAVPEEVSFAAVTERVVGRLAAQRGDRLAARLGRQRQLLAALADGMTLAELAERVSTTIGLPCRVLTPTGRTVVPGPEPLDEADIDRVVRTYLSAARLPAAVTGPATRSVFPVGPALDRLTSWFVVVDGAWSSWPGEVLDTVGELAAFAALDRSRREEGRRVAQHLGETAVRLVSDGVPAGPELQARLRQAGLDTGRGISVAVAAFADRPDLVDTVAALLDDALRAQVAGAEGPGPERRGPAMVAGDGAGAAVALLDPAGGPDDLAGALRSALGRLVPALGPTRLVVGVSRPSPPEALAGALSQARHALGLARLRTGQVEVVSDTEVTSHVALLASVPDDVRRAFAARVLDPVLDYDARNDAGLLQTLEVFLEESGSWSRVAQRMHLHVNTVRYRISRVEELTGRDAGSFEDRVDLFLALRSR